MEKQGSEELLRQNVFSSIHMSSSIKSNQVSVSYPACSLCCGGATTLSGTPNKKTARKQAVLQITLYANSSESFVVWGKKVDEPKGILWLRSCSIRRGSDNEGNMPIEMLTKGCRGRCSHTLRFASRIVAEEWYRLLKQESRKLTPMEYEDPFSSDSGEEEASPLDRILSDTTSMDATDGEQFLYQVPSSRRSSSPAIKSQFIRTNSSDNHFLSTSLPPLKNSKSCFRFPFSTSSRKTSLPVVYTSHHQQYHQNMNHLLLEPQNATDLERWSWPVPVSN